jgi:hypothetical protein
MTINLNTAVAALEALTLGAVQSTDDDTLRKFHQLLARADVAACGVHAAVAHVAAAFSSHSLRAGFATTAAEWRWRAGVTVPW